MTDLKNNVATLQSAGANLDPLWKKAIALENAGEAAYLADLIGQCAVVWSAEFKCWVLIEQEHLPEQDPGDEEVNGKPIFWIN